MIEVNIDIEVDFPADEAFAYISNFENNPEWQGGMVACRFTSEGPLQVGSTYVQEASFLGRPIHSHFEVTAFEPGRLVKATTTESTFPITFTRWVTAQGSGARIQAKIEGDSSGAFRLAEPLMRWMVSRSINKDYKNLKSILEAKAR